MIIQSSCILPRIPSRHCQWDQVPPSLWMAVSLIFVSLGGEAGNLWVLVWQHPSFALQSGLRQCLKFQVWNLFSPSTLKILIQLTLKYSCGIENFTSIDSESFAPFADHFGVSLGSYPKLPSHCLPALMVSPPTPSRPTFHPWHALYPSGVFRDTFVTLSQSSPLSPFQNAPDNHASFSNSPWAPPLLLHSPPLSPWNLLWVL